MFSPHALYRGNALFGRKMDQSPMDNSALSFKVATRAAKYSGSRHETCGGQNGYLSMNPAPTGQGVCALADDVRPLIDRCLAGDQSAMADLVGQFRGQVFGLCYRMLGHRQDAEDITQESFARALRSLARWDSSRDFRPWLLAIAGNRCRSLLAKRQRRLPAVRMVESLPDETADPLAVNHLAEEVERALGILREEYRRAFVLFHNQQLSYAEISEALRCPVGTVKTWVHRARRDLADELRRRGVVEGQASESRSV